MHRREESFKISYLDRFLNFYIFPFNIGHAVTHNPQDSVSGFVFDLL